LQIHRLLKSIAARTGVSEGDINRILSLARVMNKTCLCPLGQSVIMPLQSGLNLEVV
ncbi:MAG: hypothetical protein HXS45_07050, partial [Theionarchaea archaeon]|nr:hypothetical protein [Theionarchaea archaeon]